MYNFIFEDGAVIRFFIYRRLREKSTRHNMNKEAFALTMRRSALETRSGSSSSAASSILKVSGTELNKDRFEIMMDIMGFQALGWEGSGFSDREL